MEGYASGRGPVAPACARQNCASPLVATLTCCTHPHQGAGEALDALFRTLERDTDLGDLARQWADIRAKQLGRAVRRRKPPSLVQALDGLDAEEPTTAQFRCLVEAWVGLGEGERAADLLEDMRLIGVPPDTALFEVLLQGAISNPRRACELYLEQRELGVQRSVACFESLCDAHIRHGEWDLAKVTWIAEMDMRGERLKRRLSVRAREALQALATDMADGSE